MLSVDLVRDLLPWACIILWALIAGASMMDWVGRQMKSNPAVTKIRKLKVATPMTTLILVLLSYLAGLLTLPALAVLFAAATIVTDVLAERKGRRD